jgi:vancomycin permeability regulator SanA
MKRVFIILIVTGILWFILHIGYIIYDGFTDELNVVDVGVVLGNKVQRNGEPTRCLQGRLDEALTLYSQGYFKKIVVSGGKDKTGYYEAEVMGKYLLEHGVAEEAIIRDRKAKNTFETAVNTKRIMAEHHWKSVMIITQFYHITRTKLAFRRVGMRPLYSAHARYFESRDIYSTIREFFGFYKYLFIRERGYR